MSPFQGEDGGSTPLTRSKAVSQPIPAGAYSAVQLSIQCAPHLAQHLANLEDLDLNPDEYLITGGAVLAIHGIRDCHDLDVVCSDRLAQELTQRFPEAAVRSFAPCKSIFVNNIEFMFDFEEEGRPWSTSQQIAEADIIDGKRYQTLAKIKFFKRQQNRPKDIADIQLIEAYEAKE